MYYEVVPSKKISISLYDQMPANGIRLYSGTFTASFVCYEPFGKLLRSSFSGVCGEAELMGTGILPSDIMPTPHDMGSTSFLLYNPGTERAHTIIRLAGNVGAGLLIRNLTTGQRCKITGLTESSLLPGACLELDSAMGQTRIVLGDEMELAFPFHDEGYIELTPCTPFIRCAEVTHTEGSNIVLSPSFKKWMSGQYVYIDGWKKLSQAADGSAIVSQAIGSSGVTQTPITTMNVICVEGENAA